MASAPILFIISFVLLVSIDLRAQAEYSNTITTGSLLSPSAGNHLWCSPSGFFAFGFYPQGDGFAIGVILVTRPENVVVWTANRDDPPVSSDAKLELTKAGLLLVTMRGEKKIISINTDEISSQASSAAMLDGGNFILLNESSHVVWQSFDYPTDTILGGQNLTSTSDYPDRLVSSKSRSDHSSGRFLLIMQGDGNLVSYPSNITTMAETAYWSLGTFGNDAWLGLNQTGYLFVQNRSGMRKQIALSNGSYPGKNEVILYRVPMDDDGIFRLYSHHMVSNTSSIVWESLQNQCEVKGFCGLNSYCQETFIDEDTCKYNEDDPNKKSRINITPLENTLWYDSPYKVVNKEEEACKMLCKEDCNCWAVMYENSSCQIYNVPIRYDFFTLERMIKVGLWCIQDNPSLRPSMKNVILMLEGTMGIPVPPSPELLVLP
ncbi:hypothetical protein FEM48_Zijuj08G0184800 [Ziziphus jujuba var. spinosa]|uniref:Bulb-type lectin domain-containing protein n=1 Tax=Ziziphus jujuba var. spinosa TaxID=714518 RepID=A0A978V0N7_ZIZJJ|nr:hypothetical protein FEM48_Zijuj08G0184800 [Ziziphus jujuba var. spinosa]